MWLSTVVAFGEVNLYFEKGKQLLRIYLTFSGDVDILDGVSIVSTIPR